MKTLTIACFLMSLSGLCSSQSDAPTSLTPEIIFIHMGGSDCPPCTAWRGAELPKLQRMEVYKRIKFYKVNKVVKSSVPPRFFLHDDLKPLKEELDRASAGQDGSAQSIILVNGRVFDYYLGSHSSDELRIIFEAILSGRESPIPRCSRRQNGFCAEQIQPKG